MSTILEPEEPIKVVHIDGLAILKIMKHCQESLPHIVTGSLLGLSLGNGVLEITHAFPFPEPREDEKSDVVTKICTESCNDTLPDLENTEPDGSGFQLEMMKMLREVNVDNNCVGWYQSIYLGSYSTQFVLETQFSYQTDPDLSPNSVVVLYDPIHTSYGDLALKCYRLTDEAIELKRSETNSYLDPRRIFVNVPIFIKNPSLVQALLHDIADGEYEDVDGRTYGSCILFNRLDIATNTYLEKHLELLSNWIDELSVEQKKFYYYARGLNRSSSERERDKGDILIDMSEAWKASDAPRRLESLLIANQIKSYCEQVNKFVGVGFGKLILSSALCENVGESRKRNGLYQNMNIKKDGVLLS